MGKGKHSNDTKVGKQTLKNKPNIKTIFFIIIEIIFIALIIYSAYQIIMWFKDNNNTKKILTQISGAVIIDETKEDNEKYQINFSELKGINSDIVGWIKVSGTAVEYPVVKTNNNSFYLNHSLDKAYNAAGWIFVDYKNKLDGTDKNIVIYGHNRRDSSMFGSLTQVLNKEWYTDERNNKIIFITENDSYICEIFSIYKIKTEDYYIQTSFNSNSYDEFIKTIKNRSIYNYNIDVTSEDSVLTLSTCDNNNDYRIVVHAKLQK